MQFKTDIFHLKKTGMEGVNSYAFELKGKKTITCAQIAHNTPVIDGAEVIYEKSTMRIEFSYPLKDKFIFSFSKPDGALGGFTKEEFVACVREGYRKIYDNEFDSCGFVGTVSNRCMNRAESNGPFGIWGHYIEDLVLESAEWDENRDVWVLGIGS